MDKYNYFENSIYGHAFSKLNEGLSSREISEIKDFVEHKLQLVADSNKIRILSIELESDPVIEDDKYQVPLVVDVAVGLPATWECDNDSENHRPDSYTDIDPDCSPEETVADYINEFLANYSCQGAFCDISCRSVELNDGDFDLSDIEVTDFSHEDDGIGGYEYWGVSGYDSRPYQSVEGVVGYSGSFYIVLSMKRA